MPVVYCEKCGAPISVCVSDYKRYKSGRPNTVPLLCPKCSKRRGSAEKVADIAEGEEKEFGGNGAEVKKGKRGRKKNEESGGFGGFSPN